MLGNTILNRAVREDITIKSKALQATLGESKEKSKYQLKWQLMCWRKSQEATVAGIE